MDSVRHDVSRWLDLADQKEFQLACLETCKNVRLGTPFSMYVSQPGFRGYFEMQELHLAEMERQKALCVAKHSDPELDGEGRCSKCVLNVWQKLAETVATPRWVWFRQSAGLDTHRWLGRALDVKDPFPPGSRILRPRCPTCRRCWARA